MGFLRKIVDMMHDNPVSDTINKLDPVSNAVGDTVQEAVHTGWGKPLGSEKSGADVLGAGPLGHVGIGGDANKPSDRRVGRLVGSIFAAAGVGAAAGAATDSTAGTATATGANTGAGSATEAAGSTYTATGAASGTGAATTAAGGGILGTGITTTDVLTGVQVVSAVNSLAQAMKAGEQPSSPAPDGPAGPDQPVQDSLQPQVDPDLAAIRKRNAMLFGVDSSSSTDLTKGSAGMGNIGRVTLLGGSSRLGA